MIECLSFRKYTYPNFWDATKALLTGKCIASNVYVRKDKWLKIIVLSTHSKKLEKELKIKFKESVSKY